jgi:hypothetical protein
MTFRTHLTAVALALLGAGSAAADTGDIFFVDLRNSSGTQDGLTWTTAFDTIQEGIDAARTRFGGEVWVARGTYDEARDASTGSLNLRAGVDVYGGFRGTETRRSQRNPTVYPTIIDGQSALNGAPAKAVVDGANDAVLDGFTIEGGSGSAGAGLLNLSESPIIRNCLFRYNEAEEFGGAVLNLNGSSATFINCTFGANSAGASGGAVTNTASAATFIDCNFLDNTAGAAGGAMFNTPDSSVLIQGCLFYSNSAIVGGGGIFNEGAVTAIEKSYFKDNSTEGFGGAVFSNRAVDADVEADTLITNSVLENNHADSGGGAFATLLSSLTSVNCTIADNTAPENFGGAFFNNGAQTEVINAIIWYNSAEWIINVGDSFTQVRWSNVGGGDPGPNNIAVEPRFTDRENGDYSLLPDSPSIDAGTLDGAPVDDTMGIPRPLFDGVDQGAYEAEEKADAPRHECHGNGGESPADAMPDPASALLIGVLALASLRLKRKGQSRD